MFRQTSNRTLLTIICASILLTSVAPIKAWQRCVEVALIYTGTFAVGSAVGGMIAWAQDIMEQKNSAIKEKNHTKRILSYVEKLQSNKNFIEHNEIIKKNMDKKIDEIPIIWLSTANKNGLTISFYRNIADYEIVAVSTDFAKELIFHNVQNNTFAIAKVTATEFMAHLEKLNDFLLLHGENICSDRLAITRYLLFCAQA